MKNILSLGQGGKRFAEKRKTNERVRTKQDEWL
jgi:hypothetical protein